MRSRQKLDSSARGVTRRRFLAASGAVAGAGPWLVPASALGKGDAPAASERVTVGIIGVGGRGRTHLDGFLAESQVVAVADPRADRRLAAKKHTEVHYAEAHARGAYRGCEAYNDFRELLA